MARPGRLTGVENCSQLRASTRYTNPGRFIEAVFLVVDGGRPQVQFAGHPETEVTSLTLGIRRPVIADMTHPGRFFHAIHYKMQVTLLLIAAKVIILGTAAL